MIENVIFDFVGVIADLDFKKMFFDMSLKDKINSLRIFVSLKRRKEIRLALIKYQKGEINRQQLHDEIAKVCPNSAPVIYLLLNRIQFYVKINHTVIDYARKLHSKGIRTFIMSNAIPETQAIIEKCDAIKDAFDGIMMSNKIGLKKPSRKFFEYATKKYKINPRTTIFIDDTNKNLLSAKDFCITPVMCKNTVQTCEYLEKTFTKQLNITAPREK